MVGVALALLVFIRTIQDLYSTGADSSGEEVADNRGDLARMRFQGKLPGIEKVDGRVGNVAFERFRSGWQEEGIVLAPHCEEWRLVRAEVVLEGRIERDIALVVAEEVELDLICARTSEIEIVEGLTIRRD